VLPIAPLPELPKENFAAVEEDSLTSNTARRSITAIRNANSYFNSGFFIADRSTEPFFNRVLDRQTTASKGFVDYMDQTLLNIEIQTALVSQQLSYRKLGTDWCCPHWHLPLEPATSPCMIHFLGGRNSWKMRLISHFAAALDDVQEWLSGSTGDIHG
jgi:lipopolysaccharide biosynthesis glycosyltransferase